MQRIVAQAIALAFGVLLAIVFGVRPCDVTVGWRQPQDVVLLCKATDPVRLWPLPVRLHYQEDTGGRMARR